MMLRITTKAPRDTLKVTDVEATVLETVRVSW